MGGGIYNDDRVKKPEDNFFIYDIKTATWTKPNPAGKFPKNFTSFNNFFNYDSVNDAVVLIGQSSKVVFVYDPEANAWAEPLAMPGDFPFEGSCGNGFYDPELNAHFIHEAPGISFKGTIWVYRYKKAPEKNK
jgi:hypothetical protein